MELAVTLAVLLAASLSIMSVQFVTFFKKFSFKLDIEVNVIASLKATSETNFDTFMLLMLYS